MVHLEVRPGEWIQVPVPGDVFPVSMQIGDSEWQSAFLDHVQVAGGGTVRTVAMRRCPAIPPKRYRVLVAWPGGEVQAQVTVIG